MNIVNLIPKFVRQLIFSRIEGEINNIDCSDVETFKAFLLSSLIRILRV